MEGGSESELAHMLFKHAAPFDTLIELERQPAHCEELARRTGKGTGYLRKQLNPLLRWGCIRSSKEKNRIVYYPTPFGKLVAEHMRSLQLASEIKDTDVMDKTLSKSSALTSYIHREVSGELFDRSIIETLDPKLTFTAKLHILVKTIHPHRVFSTEDVYRECRAVFPKQKINKRNISTCLTRFRDKDNKHFIPNLYYRGNGDYLME